MIEALFSELTFWHWLVLGVLLFSIEMMFGTFDLLMVAIAAWATAVFATFLTDWKLQAVIFFLAAVALVIAGRTVFAGMRKAAPEHPKLNQRLEALVGERGKAEADFDAGAGQVKIGDSVWGAQAAEGQTIHSGDAVVVERVRGTLAIVRKA
jgi:hypothetical protein